MIDAMTAAVGASLTAVERTELDRLEADFDRQFPGVGQDPAVIGRGSTSTSPA